MLPHHAGGAGHPNVVRCKAEGSYDTVNGQKLGPIPCKYIVLIIPLSEFDYKSFFSERAAMYTSRINCILSQQDIQWKDFFPPLGL